MLILLIIMLLPNAPTALPFSTYLHILYLTGFWQLSHKESDSDLMIFTTFGYLVGDRRESWTSSFEIRFHFGGGNDSILPVLLWPQTVPPPVRLVNAQYFSESFVKILLPLSFPFQLPHFIFFFSSFPALFICVLQYINLFFLHPVFPGRWHFTFTSQFFDKADF